MKGQAHGKRLRHAVLGAAMLVAGVWSIGTAGGVAEAEVGDGGQPMPKERQSQTGESSRRVDRAEDMIALLHEGNRMEMEGARLALARGQAARVKSYARTLLIEHQRFDERLRDYATEKGLDRKSLKDQRPQATDGPIERLRMRHPQNFDRAFILAMVREHGKMVDALASTMQESRDTDLRRLLAGLLPVLERLKSAGEAILKQLPANRAD